MSYRVTILYQDEYGDNNKCILSSSDNYLDYIDCNREPMVVRDIIQHGLILPGWSNCIETREGSIIPPHRILRVWWEDSYLRDQKEKNNA